MLKGKKGRIFSKIFFGILFLILLYMFAAVTAEPPGVLIDDRVTETDDAEGDVIFYVNLTSDPWVWIQNATLYVNASTSSGDRDISVYNENYTLDLSNLANGSSNTSMFLEIRFDNSIHTGGLDSAGYYAHYYFQACGENDTNYPTGGANITQCAYSSSNSSIYINPVPWPSRSPPTIDLVSPSDGDTDKDGEIFFNISMTAGDQQTLDGGNITILLNVSGAGDQRGCNDHTSLCDPDSNVTYVWNETLTWTTAQDYESVRFNISAGGGLTGSLQADNTSIFWSAHGCLNDSAHPGNCTYATGNYTLSVSYYVPETTAPTINNIQINGDDVANGTVLTATNLNISADVSDAVGLVDNVTLYINATNFTMPVKDVGIGYTINDTYAVAATSATVQFNLTSILENETWLDDKDNIGHFPQNEGWFTFYLRADDNHSNVAYSDNFTLEIDRIPPIISNIYNQSRLNGTCQTALINWTTDEESNFTGYWYKTDLGVATNTSFSSSSFDTINLTTNMTTLISDTDYTYEATTCDNHGNCGTNISETFTFDWSLCDGWSHYGVLNSTLNFSFLAPIIEADYLSYWNGTAFSTYTTESPSLGNDRVVGRGDAFLINVNIDKVWIRSLDGNNTIANNLATANGTSVNFTAGWNMFGLLEDRTPENITYGQSASFSSTNTLSNMTFISTYNNNDSESTYRDYIVGRIRNANMTANMRTGYGPWIYFNKTIFWENRTGAVVQDP